MSPNPHYHSYLLRLWRDNAHHPWRASLQCSVTRETQTFADPLMLIKFLVEQLMLDGEPGDLTKLATWLRAQNADG